MPGVGDASRRDPEERWAGYAKRVICNQGIGWLAAVHQRAHGNSWMSKNRGMKVDAVWVSVGSLLIGAALTFLTTWLNGLIAHRRERDRDTRAAAARRDAAGREHASRALAIIRQAQTASWNRSPEHGSWDVQLDDLDLGVAEAEIELIAEPTLRPQLLGVLSVVTHPWTLANSSYSEGFPAHVQRRGLWLLREALASYVREESSIERCDDLSKLAGANTAAQDEHREWQEERERASVEGD